MSPKTFKKTAEGFFPATTKMPALFFGHGSPMNIIEDNAFSRAWRAMGKKLEKPSAVLCISAHWFVRGSYVHGAERPKTIHDFYGFPQELYAMRYGCPGSPEGAKEVRRMVKGVDVGWDVDDWGLDHGAWMVLHHLFPKADVPVFQMSIDYSKPASFHYELAKELASLRERGVLIIGSGNIVHNLGIIDPDPNVVFDWASAFDTKVKSLILDRDHAALIDYGKLGEEAMLSIPTPDHYLPLLSVLALQEKEEDLSFFVDGIVHGSIGMRGLIIGA